MNVLQLSLITIYLVKIIQSSIFRKIINVVEIEPSIIQRHLHEVLTHFLGQLQESKMG
jgi:hypothetical protein